MSESVAVVPERLRRAYEYCGVQTLVLSEVRRGPRPRTLAEVAEGIISRSRYDGDCLIFTGSKTPTGYGMVSARGVWPTPLYAHRVVYAAAHGGLPARGHDVSHLCDRKDCVNVAHLVGEPHAANMDRIPPERRGRRTRLDTEAVAAYIDEHGLWPAITHFHMSYGHALRIRRGWRPKKAYSETP